MHILARVGIIIALIVAVIAIFLHQHTLYVLALIIGVPSIVLLVYALYQERRQSAE